MNGASTWRKIGAQRGRSTRSRFAISKRQGGVILWKSEGLTVPKKLWKQSGGKEPWFRQAFEEEEERGDWMSLETPERLERPSEEAVC